MAGAERALDRAAMLPLIPDWPARLRAPLLLADLGALRLPPPPSPLLFPPTAVARAAQRLGVAYVLEGSTLGGLVLLKRLEPFGVDASHGGSFLAAGEKPRGRWPSFLDALARHDSPDFDRDAALAAARLAFSVASDRLG